MVQYVFTPWKDRGELLQVRRQFFPQQVAQHAPTVASGNGAVAAAGTAASSSFSSSSIVSSSSSSRADKKSAVSRVSMWMQRGGCPHMVESTALLIAAMIADEESMLLPTGKSATDSNSSYAVRASYSAAFSRFVTGLLDSHQDKAHKMSMYSVAKTIGLPATFVELRHQATHEQLPSLTRLRAGAQAGLVWIWDYYWKQLSAAEEDEDQVPVVAGRSAAAPHVEEVPQVVASACRDALRRYLDVGKEDLPTIARFVRRWGSSRVLSVLDAIGDEAGSAQPMDNRLVLGTLKLARQVTEMEQARDNDGSVDFVGDGGAPRSDLGQVPIEVQGVTSDAMVTESQDSKQAGGGWTRLRGSWRQKPIGFSFTPRRTMQVKSIPMWVGSSDNYAYLVIDDKTKDAVIIDPANPEEAAPPIKKAIESGEINLKAIVNTHHHWDHSGGNKKFRDALELPDLPIIGGKNCEAVTTTPANGEGFPFGSIQVKGLYTPCHTQDSICWFMQDGDDKVVFTGDTLFHGGCGRFFEGTPEEMNTALNKTLAALPDDTRVFPGHEYTKSNVKFGISVLQSEPVQKLQEFAESNKETQGQFTIGDEKKHNVFMRMDDPVIQKATGETDPVKVMGKLREMKNNFK
ncbi:hypothetical protein M0657_004631 [Pyricularia oryzae]|nr:hypothetical protein M0657_004631 [Pyricularia oryzae]KAI7926214.1 hypothetical protein M9X92_002804 [Pyricularia oryzae]